MLQIKLKLILLACIFALSSCAAIQHGDDPNYTLCKTLENKLVFRDNATLFSTNPTSTYSQTAIEGDDEDKQRLQDTYDKLNCSRYEWLKF